MALKMPRRYTDYLWTKDSVLTLLLVFARHIHASIRIPVRMPHKPLSSKAKGAGIRRTLIVSPKRLVQATPPRVFSSN